MDLFEPVKLSHQLIRVVRHRGSVIIRGRSTSAAAFPDLQKFGEKRVFPKDNS
jgi:hypothetical protein